MNEKPRTSSRPLPWKPLALALAAWLCVTPAALASEPELNPERGGSDIDLARLQGPGGPPLIRVYEQIPQMPHNPNPTPLLTTGTGWDADRVYTLCVQDPDRTDVNCIETPPGGFDHVANGTGLRNTGQGAIQVRGVPSGAVAMAAWVYWGMISSTEDVSQDLATAYFDGVEIVGNEIGSSEEPCWEPVGGAQFYAYRASVLRLLNPRITGIYDFQTKLSSITNGTDPWLNTGLPPWPEGATLVIIYSDVSVPPASTVYMSHGAALLADAIDVDHDLNPVLPAGTCGFRHSRIGADGQTSWEEQSLIPYNTKMGSAGNMVAIRGPDSAIDPDQDWQGADGGPKNQLWDTHTSELTATQVPGVPPGASTYRITYEPDDTGGPYKDCVVVVAHVLTAIADDPPEV